MGSNATPDGPRSSDAVPDRSGRVVGLLTAAFVLRGLFLAVALPIGDPLDEPYHFAYADFLSQTGRIPREKENTMPVEVARVTALLPRSTRPGGPRVDWAEFARMPESERAARRREALAYRPEARGKYAGPNYETQQPPLGYALAASLLRAFPRASIDVRLFVLRAQTVAFAACAVALGFLFFRRFLDGRSAAAATLAFVAYPGPATFTGRFTNDGLAFTLAAAVLVLLADVAGGTLGRGKTVLLAALLAAGCWTKLYFLPLLAAAPLAALAAPRAALAGMLRKTLAAAGVALICVAPWFVRQRRDTGDWLGLMGSKDFRRSTATSAQWWTAATDLISRPVLGSFIRSNAFPGTWAAQGAPKVPASAAILGWMILAGGALVGPREARPRSVRPWLGAALAAIPFGAAHVAEEMTVAAAHHEPISVTPGWYSLILLPIAIAIPIVFHRRPRPVVWIAAAACFVAADAVCAFGFLPAAYAGLARLGARSPFSSYAPLLFSPAAALASYARVGLLGWPAPALAALSAAWLAALAAAFVAVRRPARAP